jgi:hypothetical protein
MNSLSVSNPPPVVFLFVAVNGPWIARERDGKRTTIG